MALIKKADLKKMNFQEIDSKLKELKMELIKSNATAQKSGAKTKEIKRTIARLLTLYHVLNSSKLNKEVLKK